LPSQWRIAHIHFRPGDLIDATALIVLASQSKRIENLYFIATCRYMPLLPRACPRLSGMKGVRNSKCKVKSLNFFLDEVPIS
jgi:hypothetical protein